MTGHECQELIQSQLGYIMRRPCKDKVYHDGVEPKQLDKWRNRWLHGGWLGQNAAPDYVPESFDCDDMVSDFVAYCRRQNAMTGKALPIGEASVPGHFVMMYVRRDDKVICAFDPQSCEHFQFPKDAQYIGGI